MSTPTPAPEIVVILPAYNEALTIDGVIRSFHDALPEAAIWVVDNNSSDGTADLARKALEDLGCVGGVLYEMCQGKGNALRRAFTEVEADVYVLSDADQTYPADQARDLLAPVLQGRADMVVGDRHSGGYYSRENKRRFHGFGNRLVCGLINFFFGAHLQDVMSGYRVFSRRFVKTYPILVDGFQVETDMTLHAVDKRFRIVEVPVQYVDRPEGSYSKLNTFRDGILVLFTILQILRSHRPLVFFGGLAAIAMFSGLLAAVPVFDDWFAYRYIYHLPLAVLAAALEIVAVLLLSVGLILDGILRHQRADYELQVMSSGAR